MSINANGGVASNAGFEGSVTNEQQVSQFGNSAASWGSSMMSTIMNDVFGSSLSQGGHDALGGGAGPSAGGGSNSNMYLQMAFQLGQLFAELEQLAGGSGAFPGSGSGTGLQPGGGAPTPEQIFSSASGGSVGDPHESFSGSTASGAPAQGGHANSMDSQSDLIDANDSFAGGYQVSTQTTTPDSNGITYNQSATIDSNDGYSQVSMGADGQATVWDQGQYLNLQKGQTLTLSSGATVSEAQSGAVTVDDKSANGGDISTTLSWNGKGVDVNFNAQNVALGGYDTTLGKPSTVQPLVG